MKEQILQLDPHDDFISARDKMGWVQTQRVLLVWPAHGPLPLARRLDLVLLHRHAHRLGAQLALVTGHSGIREHAAELGLPVFDSVEATRKMRWRSRVPRLRPERRAGRPDLALIRQALTPRRRRWPRGLVWLGQGLGFLLGLAALAALGAALIPEATLTLTPAHQPLSVATTLAADIAQPEVDAAAGLIPARRVRVEVQATHLEPTTGVIEVPSAPATGQVVFTNLIGTAAALPAGLSLRTTSGAAVRFITTQSAALEARPGAVVQVPVQAVEPGPAGNVAASLINAIDGPLGTQLAVTNPLPTEGGATTPRAAVAPADRDRLRAAVTVKLQEAALAAIEAQLQPGEFLAPATVTVTQVLAESFDRAAGEPADALSLTLRLAAAGWAIREADAQAVAAARWQAQIPAASAPTDMALRFTRSPDLRQDAAGRVLVTITADADLAPRIDPDQARRLVVGRPLGEAAQRLQAALPLAAPPQIQLAPDWYARWFPFLPWLWLRVAVVIT